MGVQGPTLEVATGEGLTLNVTIQDRQTPPQPVDLTSRTMTFTVKDQRQPDALILKVSTDSLQIDIYDPTNGKARIFINATDTLPLPLGVYSYDVFVETPGSQPKQPIRASPFKVVTAVTVL